MVRTFGQIYSPLRQIVFGEGVQVCDASSYVIEPSYILKINLPNAFRWVVHLRYMMVAFRHLFGLWPPRCRGYQTAVFLRNEDVRPTTNPQTGGPRCFCLSGTSLSGMSGPSSNHFAASIDLTLPICPKLKLLVLETQNIPKCPIFLAFVVRILKKYIF